MVRVFQLLFYAALLVSTLLLFFGNLGRGMDAAALIFQVMIMTACLGGITGTVANLAYSRRFNRIFNIVINIFYGLALMNAIFANEWSSMTLRDVIMYLLLFSLDAAIVVAWRKTK